MKIGHILVTTDLSPESLWPCLPVAALARALGARITLLHVLEDWPLTPTVVPFEPEIVTPSFEARIEAVRARLEEQREAFDGAEVELDVVPARETVHAIIDYAEANEADLIAMSTHGRTGFRHLVLGSVTEAVLRRSPVPVVVFPQPKAEQQRSSKTA